MSFFDLKPIFIEALADTDRMTGRRQTTSYIQCAVTMNKSNNVVSFRKFRVIVVDVVIVS